ncbi:DUF2474 domain-containing protein [Pantoea cypripedii]|uniref:DUF2474 domain-containing protein n=1 Tax=Pantoea cypripedii TaxID=55209 RepID=UPI002FC8F6BF
MLPRQKNEQPTHDVKTWWKRLFWLIVIYSTSVLVLGIVASLFRLMMNAAGMRSE